VSEIERRTTFTSFFTSSLDNLTVYGGDFYFLRTEGLLGECGVYSRVSTSPVSFLLGTMAPPPF